MDIIHKGIAALIASAVVQQPRVLPEGFDLEQAYPDIKRHHIAPLAFEGACICGIPQTTPVMQKLFQSFCKAMQVSEGQQRALERMFRAFDENGIDYMPLKGCNMKRRYPKPELRMMGDADILIRLEQYEKIAPIMASLGFSPKEETDHELVWETPAVYVELHKRLMPSYNKDFHAYFGDGWPLAQHREGHRFAMTPEDEFVFIFTHFAKHYRDGGIGCRHVTDLWVFLRSFPQLDEVQVRRKLEKLQLLEFYTNLRELLAVWFEAAPETEMTDFITDYVFGSGSFGSGESRTLSRAVRDTKHTLPGISGRMVYLWQTAFPPVQTLRGKYRILKKAPWLLPVVWLIRPFYKLLFEWSSLRRQERNLDALSPENLRSRQDALGYVGLDYFF